MEGIKVNNYNNLDMKKYYLHNGTEQTGPFSIEELKGQNINRTTPVWYEGLQEWTTVENVAELQVLFVSEQPKIISQTIPVAPPVKQAPYSNSQLYFFGKYYGIIGLFLGFILLISSFYQYYEAVHFHECDQSYLVPFTAWLSIIGIAITIIVLIISFLKKGQKKISLVCFVLFISSVLITSYSESQYRKFWEPFWHKRHESQSASARPIENYAEWQSRWEFLSDEYKQGNLDIDTLDF